MCTPPWGSRGVVLLSSKVWNRHHGGEDLAIGIACFTTPPPLTGDQTHTHTHTHIPSMTKMDMAPVFAMAKCVAIVIAFKYFCFGLPYILWATAANDFGCKYSFWLLFVAKFDMMIVTLSSCVVLITLITSVGSRKQAETKFLHLFAVSAPCRQKYPHFWVGSCILCIPLVHRHTPD